MGGMFNSALGYASPITGALGVDPKQPDYVGMMEQNEMGRRNLINTGMNEINAVYGGGSADFYSQAKGTQDTTTGKWDPSQYDPTGTYYRNLGAKGWVLAKHPDAKKAKMGLLYTKSTQNFKGFQPDFFQQRAQDYIDYAMPQLGQQARATANSLTYNLANRGLMRSNVATRTASNFNRNLSGQEQGIYDSARGQANSLLQQIENSRQSAISQLYETQNPNQAANSAINSYFNLSQPSIFAPIGNAFSSILNQVYSNQLLDQYKTPIYNSGAGQGYGSDYISAGALPSTTYGSGGY